MLQEGGEQRADVSLGTIPCLGWEMGAAPWWEERKERDAALQEGSSPVSSPSGTPRALKAEQTQGWHFSKPEASATPNYKCFIYQGCKWSPALHPCAGVSSGMAKHGPAWACSSSELRVSHSRMQFQGWSPKLGSQTCTSHEKNGEGSVVSTVVLLVWPDDHKGLFQLHNSIIPWNLSAEVPVVLHFTPVRVQKDFGKSQTFNSAVASPDVAQGPLNVGVFWVDLFFGFCFC